MASEASTPKKKVPAFKVIEVGNKIVCRIANKCLRIHKKISNLKNAEDHEGEFPWFIVKFETPKKMGNPGKARFECQGKAGFREMADKILELPADATYYAFLIVKTKDNAGSDRQKFMRFLYIPDGFSAIKRSAVTTIVSHLDEELKPIAVSMDVDEEDLTTRLTAEELGKTLLAAGGAHPPTHLYFGEDMVHENVLNN